jgi:hypothetical protein
VDRAVLLIYAAELIRCAGDEIVGHGAAAERMGGNKVIHARNVPQRVGDERTALRLGVAAQFVIDAREDCLLPCPVPTNLHAAIGFPERMAELEGAAGIVKAHAEVQHGVIECAVVDVLE